MAGVAVGLVALGAVLLTLPTGDAPLVAAVAPTSMASDSAPQNPPIAMATTPPPAPLPPPPPPPAVVASGSINVSSLPRGAVLQVDGKSTSRRRLSLPPGRHYLVISLDGYATRTDTVTVVAAQTLRFAPHLEPLRSARTVATRPTPVAAPVDAPPPVRRGNPDEVACRQAMASSAWRDAYAACGRAAQGGSAAAQRNLAMLFQNGTGVRRSDDSAARWFIQGAHGGDTESEYQLAVAYEHGHGVPRNQGAALDWYTRAATAGLAAAQVVVGEAYEKGHLGLAKDRARALEWYRKAAAQGNKDAANKVRDLER
jgi:hypothetical protein